MNLLELNHVEKSFGDLSVLKDISLSVSEGEIVSIIGPSGSGKSTLLRCLNLLERPDSGKIIFDGTDILSGKVKIENIRKNACMVFQHFNLFANMTALQNVTYAPRVVNGLSRADAEAKAQKLLEKVGLGDKSGQYPSRLSGGQKQRVAIARAMVNDPALILADEPTGALDSETSRVVMDLFHEMHEKYHKTIVLITHNPALAEECQRVLTLHDGRIIAERKGSGVRGAL